MRHGGTAESANHRGHATSIAAYVRLETVARRAGVAASRARKNLSADDLLEANLRLQKPAPRRRQK